MRVIYFVDKALSSKKLKLLVMGRQNSGKTFFSNILRRKIDCYYFNADTLRGLCRDFSFDMDGRIRQAERMKLLAAHSPGLVICDFICPTPELRKIFSPDIIVYINHPGSNRYPDTQKLFLPPQKNEAEHVFIVNRGEENAMTEELVDLLESRLSTSKTLE